MSGLSDWQAGFASAMRGQGPAPGRAAVYRSSVGNGLVGALAAAFPVTARRLGPDFGPLARRFALDAPPASPVLAQWGGGFPARLPPDDAAIARLEWARIESLHAADAAPLPQATLAALPPAALPGLRLVPHPSLRLLADDTPFVSRWLGEDAAAGPEAALVLREGDRVAVSRIEPALYGLLAALAAGAALEQAAEAAPAGLDLAAGLGFAFANGLFVAVKG